MFTAPIKAENLNLKHAKSYDACPYCLTEITLEKSVPIIEASQKPEVEVEVKAKEVKIPKEKETLQAPPKTQGCAHHFGYLSERKTKEKIPEECMMCENIVQCMLKKVTG
ncbi:MAG: hypothetical protein ACPLW8_01880 [Candidatus Bathyarchaeales archaeon]